MSGFMLFKRLSLLAAMLAFCVVVLGAYVRLSDAGLGCPDWPGCYGALTVPQSEAAINQAQQVFPTKPLETGKAWKEMAHRYLAGSLGLLVLALAVLAVKQRKHLQTPAMLSLGLVLLIGMQAMLGMWTVTLLLKPAIVTLHLLGGMTTLAVLTWIAVKHTSARALTLTSSQVMLCRLFILVLLLQLMLGGWTSTNYAALACTDFPTCHGLWWPQMDVQDGFHVLRELGASRYGGNLGLDALTAIQWMHRLGAMLVLLWGLLCVRLLWPVASGLACVLLAALLLQITLGISNLLLHLPLVLAVLHNAGAALLVVILMIINARLVSRPDRKPA